MSGEVHLMFDHSGSLCRIPSNRLKPQHVTENEEETTCPECLRTHVNVLTEALRLASLRLVELTEEARDG